MQINSRGRRLGFLRVAASSNCSVNAETLSHQCQKSVQSTLRLAPLVVGRRIAVRRGSLIPQRIGEVVSRRDILRVAFGYDFDPGTNIVEVHMGHVRRKLAGCRVQIETIRGFGYRARVVT